jgi:hypothetical protein
MSRSTQPAAARRTSRPGGPFTAKDGKTVPVKEDTQTIQATGPSTTEFHISKPDGWPPGDYQVEVMQDDKVVQSKKFSVK